MLSLGVAQGWADSGVFNILREKLRKMAAKSIHYRTCSAQEAKKRALLLRDSCKSALRVSRRMLVLTPYTTKTCTSLCSLTRQGDTCMGSGRKGLLRLLQCEIFTLASLLGKATFGAQTLNA